MSIINKMLQELDRRNAIPAASDPGQMPGRVRATAGTSVGSEGFWWILAVLILLVVAWVGWVMWQLTPRHVVTDLALQSVGKPRPPQPPVVATPVPEQPPADAASGASAPAPAEAASSVAALPVAEAPKIDMLKLATEILTEIPAPRARRAADRQVADAAPAKAERPAAKAAKAEPPAKELPSAKASAAPSAPPAAPSSARAPAGDAPAQVASLAASTPSRQETAAGAGSSQAGRQASPPDAKIEKRPSAMAPREQAEVEYQRGLTLVNQGRMAEGMDSIRLALNHAPAHEAARQTLVALLIEAKRNDEAAIIIDQGLALDPKQTRLALLGARVRVELGDVQGALVLLERVPDTAAQDANFRAFRAALYQRLNRHAEAVADYSVALRASPKAGTWWTGMGISQQALNRRADALESYRQAQAVGNLGPELGPFVEQRIRQLN